MEFIDELMLILADEFVANITKTEEGLEVKFLDGRQFLVSVKEKSKN